MQEHDDTDKLMQALRQPASFSERNETPASFSANRGQSEPVRRKPRIRGKLATILIIAALLIGGGFVWAHSRHSDDTSSDTTAAATPGKPNVKTHDGPSVTWLNKYKDLGDLKLFSGQFVNEKNFHYYQVGTADGDPVILAAVTSTPSASVLNSGFMDIGYLLQKGKDYQLLKQHMSDMYAIQSQDNSTADLKLAGNVKPVDDLVLPDLKRPQTVTLNDNNQRTPETGDATEKKSAILTTDQELIFAYIRSLRSRDTGNGHSIPAGVMHVPMVPKEESTATYVVKSEAKLNGPFVVVSGDGRPLASLGHAVTEEERVYGKVSTLVQAVQSRPYALQTSSTIRDAWYNMPHDHRAMAEGMTAEKMKAWAYDLNEQRHDERIAAKFALSLHIGELVALDQVRLAEAVPVQTSEAELRARQAMLSGAAHPVTEQFIRTMPSNGWPYWPSDYGSTSNIFLDGTVRAQRQPYASSDRVGKLTGTA